MTDEHKALVTRLRKTKCVPSDCPDIHAPDCPRCAAYDAIDAIEALAAENDGFRRGWEAALERAVAAEIRTQAAEERAEALIAELRAKETEIETLSAEVGRLGVLIWDIETKRLEEQSK